MNPAIIDKVTGPRPTVSVVMAAYNLERYVAEAARSVLAQSFSDIELIIVDDGSTDGTARALDSVRADPRVRYLRQENAGQASAKNAGLRETKGKFVAFLDGDDLWPKDRLQQQLSAMSEHQDVDIVYGQVHTIDHVGTLLTGPGYEFSDARRYSGSISSQLFSDNFISFGAVLVRRRCFEEMGGFDETLRMGIDWDLWLRFSTRFLFLYHPHLALYYREWGGQMSNNWQGRYEHAFIIMHRFLQRFPDALDRSSVRRGLSDAFVGRARSRARMSRQLVPGLLDCARAVASDPTNFVAYKSVGRVVIDSVFSSSRNAT